MPGTDKAVIAAAAAPVGNIDFIRRTDKLQRVYFL